MQCWSYLGGDCDLGAYLLGRGLQLVQVRAARRVGHVRVRELAQLRGRAVAPHEGREAHRAREEDRVARLDELLEQTQVAVQHCGRGRQAAGAERGKKGERDGGVSGAARWYQQQLRGEGGGGGGGGRGSGGCGAASLSPCVGVGVGGGGGAAFAAFKAAAAAILAWLPLPSAFGGMLAGWKVKSEQQLPLIVALFDRGERQVSDQRPRRSTSRRCELLRNRRTKKRQARAARSARPRT
jgi:hypothetical protein